MAVKILWSPMALPEERKRAQWERIIRFELGDGVPDTDVSLSRQGEGSRWLVETPVPAQRQRIVQALRATGKPVE
jgi:hypothetical protein